MTGLRTLPTGKKRIRRLALLLAILQAFFLFQPVTAAEQGNERIYFELGLPKETGGADRIMVIVKLRIPDGVEVYGFSTGLSVPMPYFSCSRETIVVGSRFTQDCLGGMGEQITFRYENAHVPLTAGEYTLFAVQFTIREDTPSRSYTIQTMTQEAYTSDFDQNGEYLGSRDLAWTDMNGSVYVGTLFAVTPETVTMETGQTITVSGNKPVVNAYVQNSQIASYSSGKITALSVGSTLMMFTADTGETCYVRVTVKAPEVKPPPSVTQPTAIASQKYLVSGGRICKVPPGTSVSAFLAGFENSSLLTVYRSDGKTPMQGSELVGTGCVVKLTISGTVQDSKRVTVTADVNGDGKITAADYVNVKFEVLGKQTLTDVYFEAADVNGDGKVTAADYVNIKFHVLGKAQISPR